MVLIANAENRCLFGPDLEEMHRQRKVVFVDYYAPLSDGQGALRADLSNDGVHPNRNGYALMRPIAERAIAQAAGRAGP